MFRPTPLGKPRHIEQGVAEWKASCLLSSAHNILYRVKKVGNLDKRSDFPHRVVNRTGRGEIEHYCRQVREFPAERIEVNIQRCGWR